MNFWSITLTIVLHVAQLEASWNPMSALIMNKIGDRYAFPEYVNKLEESSLIQYIKPGDLLTKTYAFCKDDTISRTFLKGNLLSENPSKLCDTSVRSVQKPKLQSNGNKMPCGSKLKQNGFWYQMSYTLSINKEFPSTYILYDFCLDEKLTAVLYAKYAIPNPSLLENKLLADEREYNFPLISSSQLSRLQEAYSQNAYNYARPIGVPEFVPFALWRESFYRYETSAPMNKELTEVWRMFLNNIRLKLSKVTELIHVYSGVYDIKRVHGSATFLAGDKTPIPNIWWVLLYNENKSKGVSLIIHNYAFDLSETHRDPLCGESVCKDAGLEDAIPDKTLYHYALIYCCPASFITDKFPFPEAKDPLNF